MANCYTRFSTACLLASVEARVQVKAEYDLFGNDEDYAGFDIDLNTANERGLIIYADESGDVDAVERFLRSLAAGNLLVPVPITLQWAAYSDRNTTESSSGGAFIYYPATDTIAYFDTAMWIRDQLSPKGSPARFGLTVAIASDATYQQIEDLYTAFMAKEHTTPGFVISSDGYSPLAPETPVLVVSSGENGQPYQLFRFLLLPEVLALLDPTWSIEVPWSGETDRKSDTPISGGFFIDIERRTGRWFSVLTWLQNLRKVKNAPLDMQILSLLHDALVRFRDHCPETEVPGLDYLLITLNDESEKVIRDWNTKELTDAFMSALSCFQIDKLPCGWDTLFPEELRVFYEYLIQIKERMACNDRTKVAELLLLYTEGHRFKA